MQISESLGVFVKGVSGTGIMPQVWQSPYTLTLTPEGKPKPETIPTLLTWVSRRDGERGDSQQRTSLFIRCAQVWQSHGMMSSLLEDMTTNLTEEETVFKNFHNEAWAMLSPLQRAIFITESAPCYPDILAMVNSLALLSQHAAAELAEREAEHASDDE
jgi:hypothetical protein